MNNIKPENIKGSITIETIIIIPFVFFCVIFAIFIPLRLYRAVSIQVAADLAAQRGAAVWDNINKDITTGKIHNRSYELYWRLYDGQKEMKALRIKNWLFSRLDGNPVLKTNERTAVVEIKDYIILKKLQIEAADKSFREKAFAESMLIEPAEFIRNTDFLMEVIKKIGKYCPEVNNVIDELKKVINDIKNRVSKVGAYEN
ncbi:MAG: hypothetical protein HPY74_16245 [Firmicutes bacterium]|nr:hypothetical protein [Bacillota bacterium]